MSGQLALSRLFRWKDWLHARGLEAFLAVLHRLLPLVVSALITVASLKGVGRPMLAGWAAYTP